MSQPSMQVATQRLRQSLTWCKQWRSTHPKWFRAGLVACVLVGLYASGWLLSLFRAVLWLLVMLAISTAGLLWASQRWAWIAGILDGRRWLLTRRPYVALIAAGMMSVALWLLPSSRSAIAEREPVSATASSTMEEAAGTSPTEPADASRQSPVTRNVAETTPVESQRDLPLEPKTPQDNPSRLIWTNEHHDQVKSVAFSPDGKRLASASRDQSVKVLDATTGQIIVRLNGHTGLVKSVAFCSDRKRLASASSDNTVKVWDVTSGQLTRTLNGHTSEVWCVAFSPDGKRLASASQDGTVKVWDTTSGKLMLTLNGRGGKLFWSVAFSPDGKRLASASFFDPTVEIWDATNGEMTLNLKGHTREVESVAFSPDGKRLASASSDKSVKVWDAITGQEILTMKGHADRVSCVAFSPDGKRLASAGGDRTVRVWDVTTGQEMLALNGHTDSVNGVAFSPDGELLASASDDKAVKVWDIMRSSNLLKLVGTLSPAVRNSWTSGQVKAQDEEAQKGRSFTDPGLPSAMGLTWGGAILKQEMYFSEDRCFYEDLVALQSIEAAKRSASTLREKFGKTREFQPSEVLATKPEFRVIEADSWSVLDYHVYSLVLAKDEPHPVTGQTPSHFYMRAVVDRSTLRQIEHREGKRATHATGSDLPIKKTVPNKVVQAPADLPFTLDDLVKVLGEPNQANEGSILYNGRLKATKIKDHIDIAFSGSNEGMFFAAGLFTSRLFTKAEGDQIIDFIDEIGQDKVIGRFKIRVGKATEPRGWRQVSVSPKE